MRFELTTSTLAIFAQLMTPFGKPSNINHIVSRDVACRPLVSRAKWKVEWKDRGLGRVVEVCVAKILPTLRQRQGDLPKLLKSLSPMSARRSLGAVGVTLRRSPHRR